MTFRRVAIFLFVGSALADSTRSFADERSIPIAQRTAYNNVFIELGGNAFLGSTVNYDRMFGEHLSLRFGVGVAGLPEEGVFLSIPVLVNFLMGSSDHKFELGIGMMTLVSSRVGFPAITSVIGYRYAPRNGGLSFRAGLTATVWVWKGPYRALVLPWAGVSAGYQF